MQTTEARAPAATREMFYNEALGDALRLEMERDERVIVIGEDIAEHGGAFQVTAGLLDKFGPTRIRQTPISEIGIVGAAVGSALTGLRPVVDRVFGFEEIREALRYLESGSHFGKVCLRA